MKRILFLAVVVAALGAMAFAGPPSAKEDAHCRYSGIYEICSGGSGQQGGGGGGQFDFDLLALGRNRHRGGGAGGTGHNCKRGSNPKECVGRDYSGQP